jgi:hypothetical protein
MNVRAPAISFALCGFLAAAPAAAVESLTGTWEGTLKCQTTDSGIRTKTKVDQTVAIEDLGVDGVTMQLVSTEGVFNGFVVADEKKAENGVLSAVSCNFSDQTFAGGVLNVEVKTKTGDPKASLKGDLILMNDEEDVARTCQLSVKRVSQTAPKILGCVPL